MFDKIDKIGKSIIQHGPNNDRVYLMKLHPDDASTIVDSLSDLAIMKRYSKIFAKIPEWALDKFISNNYKIEGSIPDFYQGKIKVYFVSLFFSAKRSFLSKKKKAEIESIVDLSSNYFNAAEFNLPPGYSLNILNNSHAKTLAQLYKTVFEVYPFPIFKEKYILKTMQSNVIYFGVFKNDNLIAASSAEMDPEGENVEMTDFATHPNHLGQNLSYFLLSEMEKEMKDRGMKTLYTIARSHSHGMNKTFGRSEYIFGGTLINNTQIGASIESMNIWYKHMKQIIPKNTIGQRKAKIL
jgi:putative beta-lysine N-acetyltransferase